MDTNACWEPGKHSPHGFDLRCVAGEKFRPRIAPPASRISGAIRDLRIQDNQPVRRRPAVVPRERDKHVIHRLACLRAAMKDDVNPAPLVLHTRLGDVDRPHIIETEDCEMSAPSAGRRGGSSHAARPVSAIPKRPTRIAATSKSENPGMAFGSGTREIVQGEQLICVRPYLFRAPSRIAGEILKLRNGVFMRVLHMDPLAFGK